MSALIAGAISLPASADTLSIGHTTWVGYGTLYLAQEKGFFEENGLDVELPTFEGSSGYMSALASGDLQGVAGTIAELVKYRSADFCFKAVVVLDDSYGGDGVVTESNVTSIHQLQGMTVGMNEGGASQFWLSYLLRNNNLSLSDVNIQNMSADAAAAAFIAGRIPVAVTWEPNLSFIRSHDRGHILVDSSETPGVIIDVVALSCDVIEQRPDDVNALVKGLYKAVDYFKNNPQASYALMAEGVGGYLEDPQDFAEATEGVRFYNESDNQDSIGNHDSPGNIADLVRVARETWNEVEGSSLNTTYSDIVDPSFIHQP
ncbi:ABC transporter substrate-binding protein [Kushneria aurantia]|uniref:ABC transporter substrate-binding protein n=1 Tax=Kushneria aurantia TaxID=504092 RepID=A0ABV6G0P8_9GAMM